MIRTLFPWGADANAQDAQGETAAHIAIKHNKRAAWNALRARTDIDIKAADGYTARGYMNNTKLT